MQQIFSIIRQVAPTSAPVLISGESGTGKELVAREIHKCSPRADGPFVAINAAALPETLVESELFGHEKGAFTGAMERSAGCFEQAHGGTLLLDEIGEMPASTQPKLLRVLEDLRVRRLGGKHEIAVDARVLAATSHQLGTHLREELYYRLSVFQIEIPPLREHKEDIPPIAEVMLRNLNKKHSTRVTGVDAEVMDLFHRYDWPGNVRELRNVLERAAIMAGEGLIRLTHLPSPAFAVSPARSHGPHPAMRALSCSSQASHSRNSRRLTLNSPSITCAAIANSPPRCWGSACGRCRTGSPHCAKRRRRQFPAHERRASGADSRKLLSELKPNAGARDLPAINSFHRAHSILLGAPAASISSRLPYNGFMCGIVVMWGTARRCRSFWRD